MTATEDRQPSVLDATQSQLQAYARDLRRLITVEQEKSRELEQANAQLQAYARDLKLALQAEQVRARETERAYLDTVMRLTLASEYKDEETGSHIRRLSYYAETVALKLGWSAEAARQLRSATPLHDVGKIAVPDRVLLKPGPLDADEWALMMRHTEFGASLLKGSPSPVLQLGAQIARSHHERWNGSGYPDGLRGEQIPVAARIVMLVDQYDALRSRRPYKATLDHEQTVQVILAGDGRTLPEHFDPALLAVFREAHPELEYIFERYHD
jgi:putative two-component system response regulator